MEQPDVVAGTGVSVVAVKLALSSEARASLEAVRVAQETARVRARRETLQTRIWFAIGLGAVALAAVALAPRVARLRAHRAKVAAVKPAAPAAALTAPASTPTPPPPEPAPQASAPVAMVAAPAQATTSENSLARAPETQPAPVRVTAPEAGRVARTEARDATSAEGCDIAAVRHAWHLSPEACARAAAADPKSASFALAAAQAYHAHARLPDAAQWAKRALALDPNAAEAYIIVARDALANGNQEAALAAYRRYLEVAPRGWHKPEARAAVRRATGERR